MNIEIDESPKLQNWVPNEKQEEFLQLPDDVFEALYGGAAGPGKSEILLLIPILREFYKKHDFKGIIFRRNLTELESEMIPRAQKYYPQTGAIWNGKTNTFKWPMYRSQIKFGHIEHDKDKKKYDSAEYQYAAFDELTHFLWGMYNYLFSRMRAVGVDIEPIVRSGSNPGGVGHAWVRRRFIEPHREGGRLLEDPETGRLRYFLAAKLEDNPHLLKNDPNYVKSLMMMTPAERAAKLNGDWWTFQGQVFSFRSKHRSDEPKGACHVIPYTQLPAGWPRFLATDVGFTAKTFSLWAAVSPDDEVFIYREHGDKGGLVSQWARDVGQLSQGENLCGWEIDHTVFEGDRTDVRLVDDIKRASRLKIAPQKAAKGKGSRHTGMVLLQEYLNWLNERERPRLYFMDTCVDIINTIPLCVFKKDKLDEDVNDVEEFEGDDPYDTLRYLMKMVDRFIKARRAGTVDGYDEAKIHNLAVSNDWMSYFIHREMARAQLSRGRRRRVVV